VPTFACCAAATPTEHRGAPTDPCKVVTKLLPDMWEAELRVLSLLEEFGDIPGLLRAGFLIGVAGPVKCTKIRKDHKSFPDRPDIICELNLYTCLSGVGSARAGKGQCITTERWNIIVHVRVRNQLYSGKPRAAKRPGERSGAPERDDGSPSTGTGKRGDAELDRHHSGRVLAHTV
jgi:hypothetical protein